MGCNNKGNEHLDLRLVTTEKEAMQDLKSVDVEVTYTPEQLHQDSIERAFLQQLFKSELHAVGDVKKVV